MPFFIDQQEHYNEFSESLEESISEENSVFDESFHLSDEDYSTDESEDEGRERDILNSSKDPLKSSKITVFWSCLVTLFGSSFTCERKFWLL